MSFQSDFKIKILLKKANTEHNFQNTNTIINQFKIEVYLFMNYDTKQFSRFVPMSLLKDDKTQNSFFLMDTFDIFYNSMQLNNTFIYFMLYQLQNF